MKLHYHLIINENAGGGNGKNKGDELQALLKEDQASYTSYFTQKPGDEIEIAAKLAKTDLSAYEPGTLPDPFPLLVVIGGDGTLSKVVNALANFPEVPIAYIPAGSGNDFSRANGIYTKDTRQSYAYIKAAKEPKEVKVLAIKDCLQDQVFLAVNSVGFGVDAAVIEATHDSQLKRRLNRFRLGGLAYPISVVRVLFKQKAFRVQLQLPSGSRTFTKTFLVTAASHPYFGGGIPIAPKACLTKNQLDLILIEKISWGRIFSIIRRLFKSRHLEHQDVHYHQYPEMEVLLLDAQPAQADGEVLGNRQHHFTFTTTSRYFWF